MVSSLHTHSQDALDTTANGGMRCPLRGHDHWLSWEDGDHRKGTQRHDDPPLTFRISPTYILEDPLANFIAGRDLVADMLNRQWKKAETFRLGHENSEDAVSWNVFRSLQEAGELKLAARVLAGIACDAEPELIVWGRRIDAHATTAAAALARALGRLEPRHRQQTEPDVVLRVPEWGWLFIEAKLSSPMSTYARRGDRLRDWIERYAAPSPGLFDPDALRRAEPRGFPEQLLRNVAVADAVRGAGERAVVVALVRGQHATSVQDWGAPYVLPDAPVATGSASWEQLYGALPADDAALAPLRRYMRDKSVRLRPAFDLRGSRPA